MPLPGSVEAVQWEMRNEAGEVRRLVRRLRREAVAQVLCAYEAGPCGYEAAGSEAFRFAPSR
jgi:hypothetical protein